MAIKDPSFYSNDISSQGYIESTASSTRKSKEKLGVDSLIPSEILENSAGINPTGQAGYFLDQHYQNQTPLYLAGEYRKQRINRKGILANQTSRLIFSP